PDPAPHRDGIDARPVQILAVVKHLALDTRAGDQVVHPVEAADERALAAARRPDERRHEVAVDLDADVLDRDRASITDGEVPDVEDDLTSCRRASIASLCDLDRRHGRDRIRCLHLFLRHRDSLRRLRASAALARTLRISTNAIRTSAAAHARAWSAGSGDSRSWKI